MVDLRVVWRTSRKWFKKAAMLEGESFDFYISLLSPSRKHSGCWGGISSLFPDWLYGSSRDSALGILVLDGGDWVEPWDSRSLCNVMPPFHVCLLLFFCRLMWCTHICNCWLRWQRQGTWYGGLNYGSFKFPWEPAVPQGYSTWSSNFNSILAVGKRLYYSSSYVPSITIWVLNGDCTIVPLDEVCIAFG